MMKRIIVSAPIMLFICSIGLAQGSELKSKVDQKLVSIEPKVIEWRHHLHQYPELSNREYKTAAYIEDHLRKLGLEVRTKIAHTGVVGILRGDKPGPVVALRADMDALPVKEKADLPFASKEKGEYLGETVDVMHACGHDAHVAILMGAAEILSSMKSSIEGTIVFIFQPAEEQAPPGEEGGAKLMMKEGVLDDPLVDVIFALHTDAGLETGKLNYRPGSATAAVNTITIKVHGKSTHGAAPWTGIDPIVVSAQIIMGLQTIVSRQMNIASDPVVITIGKISGGVRSNIIPEEVTMLGTVRTFDTTMERIALEKIKHTAQSIAESAGATADVEMVGGYPVTVNDPDLTYQMVPSLIQAAGKKENVTIHKARTTAEDFSFFAQEIPAFYFYLGSMAEGMNPENAPKHHTSDFLIDEKSFALGVKSLCYLALDYSAYHTK